MKTKVYSLTVVAALLFLTATHARSEQASLFDRLGGTAGIDAVVDDLIEECMADDRIDDLFTATAADPKRLAKFKLHLVDQICEAAGGPCEYRGKHMEAAHRDMLITNEQFDAMVEDLVKAMDENKVAKPEQNELLAILGPMKKDIVGK
jgi:hemoglobin